MQKRYVLSTSNNRGKSRFLILPPFLFLVPLQFLRREAVKREKRKTLLDERHLFEEASGMTLVVFGSLVFRHFSPLFFV